MVAQCFLVVWLHILVKLLAQFDLLMFLLIINQLGVAIIGARSNPVTEMPAGNMIATSTSSSSSDSIKLIIVLQGLVCLFFVLWHFKLSVQDYFQAFWLFYIFQIK